LSSLPPTLNETYDSILLRISRSTQTHQDLVKTALRWLAVAQQPLLVEQLIEACTVRTESGGQVREELRLSPAKIVLLLRHLVVLEKNGGETDEGPASTVACNKDLVVFAHFSVKEYLTIPEYMAPDIRSKFTIDPKRAHLEVASSCIAYLLRTNVLEERKNEFPLREYAWDLWALHTVSSTTDTATKTSEHAQTLYEQVAFGSDYDIPGSLQPIIFWASSKRAVLDCLRNPYFFEEYSDGGSNLDNPDLTAYTSRHHDYKPLDFKNQEIRLLRIVPNRHGFAGIRCSMIHTSLGARQRYEAISYTAGNPTVRKCIWLNGNRFHVPANSQANLRAIRNSSLQGQLIWMDAICIDQQNLNERFNQVVLMPGIFASAVSVTIVLGNASEDDVWALEIIRLIGQLSETHSDILSTDLSNLLRSRRSTDPFVCLLSLFRRSWWERSWVLQEAVLGNNPVLLYGVRALPLASLQKFVSLADRAFQLIGNAFPNSGYDPAVLKNTVHWENVLGLIRMRAQHQCGVEPRSITRLLYASRYLKCTISRDRFYSLYALIPPGARTVDYTLSSMEVSQEFCSYAILVTKNLDLFTLYFSEKPEESTMFVADPGPSWADFCVSSRSMDVPRPLLYHELVNETDGTFCAGGREFREAPAIDQHKRALTLEGFTIDSIEAIQSHPTDVQNDQAQLDHKGHGDFSRRRRWFRASGGLAVLGPEKAQAGHMLAILIGGKTPYLLERILGIANHFHLVGEWYVENQNPSHAHKRRDAD
jgi:hypothetical protein